MKSSLDDIIEIVKRRPDCIRVKQAGPANDRHIIAVVQPTPEGLLHRIIVHPLKEGPDPVLRVLHTNLGQLLCDIDRDALRDALNERLLLGRFMVGEDGTILFVVHQMVSSRQTAACFVNRLLDLALVAAAHLACTLRREIDRQRCIQAVLASLPPGTNPQWN